MHNVEVQPTAVGSRLERSVRPQRSRSENTMPRHCPGCSHPTICRTHGCAALEYRRNKERKMEGLPKFNPRSDAQKPRSEPGPGDDVPCVKCGGALDTGLECTECNHDNHEAVTGKPFGA